MHRVNTFCPVSGNMFKGPPQVNLVGFPNLNENDGRGPKLQSGRPDMSNKKIPREQQRRTQYLSPYQDLQRLVDIGLQQEAVKTWRPSERPSAPRLEEIEEDEMIRISSADRHNPNEGFYDDKYRLRPQYEDYEEKPPRYVEGYKTYEEYERQAHTNPEFTEMRKEFQERNKVVNLHPVLAYVNMVMSMTYNHGPAHNLLGTQIKCLIDTGCSKTTISRDVYDFLVANFNNSYHDITEVDISLMSCTGDLKRIDGMFKIRVYITPEVYRDTTAMVVDGLAEDVILGYDFLSSPWTQALTKRFLIMKANNSEPDIHIPIQHEYSDEIPCHTLIRESYSRYQRGMSSL
jgi:hypothetical protein